jgi:DNA-binding MarR family transcriptional regulator
MSENSVQVNPERLLFDIWLVSRATTGLLDAALAPVGLTADEFALHSALHHTGSVTPSRLAELLAIPPTTISTHLRRLEQRGAIVRVRNPADGRSAFLQLTDQGEATYHRAREIFVPLHERIAAILTVSVGDAQTMLAELSRAIHQTHEEREAAADPSAAPPVALG